MRYVYVYAQRPLIRGLLAAAALLACFPVVSFARGYFIHHYSESSGLNSANVHDITQDHLGRMWFATRAGISVYDSVVRWNGTTARRYSIKDGLIGHETNRAAAIEDR